MKPARAALRDWIKFWDAEPVMWEELAPRDQDPERAYLEGVDRSHICILLLGHAYGVSDKTGFSPTHKEGNRAAKNHITRLLFQPEGILREKRDGRLNSWVDSMYNEVSGGKYTDEKDLVTGVARQLRVIADGQESSWIKLGSIVVPGMVRSQTVMGATDITIEAKIRDYPVRHQFSVLSHNQHLQRMHLTWGVTSHWVEIQNDNKYSHTVSEDEVSITARPVAGQPRHSFSALGGVTFQRGTRSVGPVDQAKIWVDRAIFGGPTPYPDDGLLDGMTGPDGKTLPQVLSAYQAEGWLAEGLTRLYLVESMLTRFNGHFSYVQIGPATATGIRVLASFTFESFGQEQVEIQGTVPL